MYLNKLLILRKLQQANTHLGLTIGRPGTRWSRFNAQRAQSYIYGFRAAQPIIDLDKTVISLRRACNVIQLIIRSNGHLLFVNTNPKYNKIVQQTAKCTNQSFINHKWIGGFLTNWNHMRNVQQQFHAAARFTKAFLKEGARTWRPLVAGRRALGIAYEEGPELKHLMASPPQRERCLGHAPFGEVDLRLRRRVSRRGDSIRCNQRVNSIASDSPRASDTHPAGNMASPPAKSALAGFLTDPRYKKMQKCFEGLRKQLPVGNPKGIADCVIIFNANQNSTAIYEAHLNQIPIISIVDSNIPNELYNLITYPIPANSESVQFIYLFCNCILKTILVSR